MIKKNQIASVGFIISVAFLVVLFVVGVLEPLIPWGEFGPSYIDIAGINGLAPSMSGDHFLGTDLLGRDVLKGLISGCKVSVFVMILATFFSLLFAILISIVTSYVGDESFHLHVWQIAVLGLIFFLSVYYIFIAFIPAEPSFTLIIEKVLLLVFILIATLYWFSRMDIPNEKKIRIPLDTFGLKLFELYTSIPSLIVLLLFVGLSPKRGVVSLSFIMGLLLWPGLYRYLRIEIIRGKSLESFHALRNLGFAHFRVLFVHLLPSALIAILTPIIFLMTNVVIAESSLSFLGLGISDDIISWGKILAQARMRIDAWWLAVFPGLLIFFTLYSLNFIAKRLESKI